MVHRIDGPGATAQNLFTEGDPGQGIQATTVTDDWLNDVQEELVTLVEQAGLTPTKGTQDQVRKAIAILQGSAAADLGAGQMLANAAFEWQQRIATTALPKAITADGYIFDRWWMSEGAATVTVDKTAPSPGSSPFPAGGEGYYLSWDQTAAGANAEFHQRVEALEALDGREVTFSFYAKVASGSIQVTPRFRQNFGPSGSSEVVTDGSAITVDTTWTRYTVTLTLPSISGKTVDSSLNYLAVGLVMPNSTFTLSFGWPKFEVGDAATPWEKVPEAVDTAVVMRYYQKSYNPQTAPGAVSQNGKLCGGHVSGTTIRGLFAYCLIPMRATPVVTWYSPNTGTKDRIEIPNQTDRTVTSTSFSNRKTIGVPVISGTDPGAAECEAHWTADAEI